MRRQHVRRQWGHFGQDGGAVRSNKAPRARRFFHKHDISNDSFVSRSFTSPKFGLNSAEGQRPFQVSPHVPPMVQLNGGSGQETVFSIVGIPSVGLSYTSIQNTGVGGDMNGNLGSGRQAELARQDEQGQEALQTPSSPFADPDPFRSSPPTYGGSQSGDSHETIYALTTDHAMLQASMNAVQHAANAYPSNPVNIATPPSRIAPSAGAPPMKPTKITIAEPLRPPPPVAMPAPARPLQPPVAKTAATLSPANTALQRARNAFFNSRHHTQAINPFGDSNSPARSSLASSAPSVYSVDDTATSLVTDDGVPTMNRRERQLHASDLYLARTSDLRTSRAASVRHRWFITS